MSNPILLGQAETFPAMRTGTVWLDKAGKIGVIIGETGAAFLLQTYEHIIELVPREAQKQFETTVECLGEL